MLERLGFLGSVVATAAAVLSGSVSIFDGLSSDSAVAVVSDFWSSDFSSDVGPDFFGAGASLEPADADDAEDSEDGFDAPSSACAMALPLAIAEPIPSATASAPTRPTY